MASPIKVFSHASGPNSWKINILLDELNIPYETVFKGFEDLHTPEFAKYSLNGRVPVIVDPNTNITLWESGAIIKYIIETYDKEGKLNITTSPEKYLLDQWLFFQASGQGPYFGQALWFSYFHSDTKIASAKERYINEIKRVTKVLDSALAGKEYLVGDKLTFADLAFVPWYWGAEGLEPVSPGLFKGLKDELPNFKRWIERLYALPSVEKAVKDRKDAMATPN
ncbi:Glutathione S-transferase protein [Rutstroemia sp. NJR-2017a BVV2]|nr:Glutathione S-transferase protein [Rutstroemia sp. NJR-2017a BVV2]